MPDLPPLDTKLTRADYTRLARDLESAPDARRVAVLASFTADFLAPCLTVEAARRAFPISVWLAPFGQIEQQALDPRSDLYAQTPDVILVLPRLEDWMPEALYRFVAMDEKAQSGAVQEVQQRLTAVIEAIRRASPAKIVLGTFAPPMWQAGGIAATNLQGFVQALNSALVAASAAQSDTAVLDVARVAMEVGLSQWRDERLDYLAKAPWSADACAALAKAAARVIRASFVTPKKCLVLDMDNTLWGGVLGEAGMEGIALGPDYPGNVFLDFQRRVLALRDSGVILAAASKNNAADVEEVLAKHPACLLKREHFAAFEVHWEDKAVSMRRIAQTLNIGIDALVFFDDNPAEREWVRQQLPQVTVLEVPASPMGYAKVLDQCGCFDMPHLTSEDRQRAGMYQQEVQRQELRTQVASLDDYLRSLEMVLTIGDVNADSMARIAQLLSKTNQFNLTTHRHSATDLQQMTENGGVVVWARLKDRFGDAGLIAAAILLPVDADTWRLDTFLMSCRVIGRGVETALLAVLERRARAAGARTVLAEFIPTAKNQPAADFLPKHGFAQTGAGNGQWQMDLTKVARVLPEYLVIEETSS